VRVRARARALQGAGCGAGKAGTFIQLRTQGQSWTVYWSASNNNCCAFTAFLTPKFDSSSLAQPEPDGFVHFPVHLFAIWKSLFA